MARKVHLSARGSPIDFDLLQSKNSRTVAIGNVPMNAHGDRLGSGGKIIQKVEDVPAEQLAQPNTAYNRKNPKAVKMISLKDNIDNLAATMSSGEIPSIDAAKSPSQIVDDLQNKNMQSRRKIVDSE